MALKVPGHAIIDSPTEHVGGRIDPTLIVLHETASRVERFNSRNYLMRNDRQVSCHFVIERDGTISQLAPTDRRTNHAGASSWRGRSGCNGFSIGIELVGPGRLDATARSWFGQTFDSARYVTTFKTVKAGYWLPFTDEQVLACAALIEAIQREHPNASEIVAHYDVSPGRKEDPNPLLPAHLYGGPVAANDNRQDVREMQERLLALGFHPGLIDGVIGTRTKAALWSFQTENGLPATGIADGATLERLESADAKPMPTGHREDLVDTALAKSGTMTDAKADTTEGGVQAAVATSVAFVTSIKSFVDSVGGQIFIATACGVALYLAYKQIKRGESATARRIQQFLRGL